MSGRGRSKVELFLKPLSPLYFPQNSVPTNLIHLSKPWLVFQMWLCFHSSGVLFYIFSWANHLKWTCIWVCSCIGEDSWESPWTARISNQSILKEISPEYSLEGRCWSWGSNTLATWWEELTHWKRPWCWERMKVGGEGDDRGWDGWMTSLTQWIHIYVNSNLPTHSAPPPPLGVHTCVFYVCVSISALQIGSSVPFSRFWRKELLCDLV